MHIKTSINNLNIFNLSSLHLYLTHILSSDVIFSQAYLFVVSLTHTINLFSLTLYIPIDSFLISSPSTIDSIK